METTPETSALNLENKELGSVEIEICEETNLNNEDVKVNVTFKSPLIASLKRKMAFVYNKFMKLVSCTTKAVDTTHEPTTLIEELINIKEPVTDIEEPVVVEEAQAPVIVEEPEPVASVVNVEPVVVEQPVSIEERM